MKSIWIVICLCFTAMVPFSHPHSATPAEASPPAKPIPAYAKWSRLAIKEAKKRYPTAQIKDFLYLGRAQQGPDKTVERFKLWVQNQNKEFGLFITIVFDTKTEKVQSISFVESPT
ncbi:YqzG/YhdC family protein [Priestia abyssalis]|uniref:YqzG/YhdC family protein n=1 Tax=Priestia abyssalis TaxID=1221450 RepID=UPI0009959330|nr:YqzG/YhdC family protein [Priestia abyssalis]